MWNDKLATTISYQGTRPPPFAVAKYYFSGLEFLYDGISFVFGWFFCAAFSCPALSARLLSKLLLQRLFTGNLCAGSCMVCWSQLFFFQRIAHNSSRLLIAPGKRNRFTNILQQHLCPSTCFLLPLILESTVLHVCCFIGTA